MARFIYGSLILLLLCGIAGERLSAQSGPVSKNMTLFDHLEPVSTAEAEGPHSACWGYAAPDGREYGFLGTQIGTSIIDITEKPIRQVAFIPGPRSAWREIKVYGQYAFISSESRDTAAGAGLQIVDLSLLPESATLVRTDRSHFVSAHTIWIADHYLYAMGTQADAGVNGGAIILDLEPDPLHPRRAGGVDPHYFHDAFVRNDTLLGAAIYDGNGCDIYNIADKENPVRIGTITYPFSGTHNAELTADGRYVLTSDEIGFTPKTMKVWDISDPDDIVMVAEFTPNIAEIVHNVRIKEEYAVVAWYTAGVRIVDIADPVHPREVGFYDTYTGPNGGFNGVWEVYPYFPSGKIIASDRNSGLYVMEFNGARAGSVSGIVRNTATNAPLPNTTIHVPEYNRTVTTNATGSYYIGGVNGERITVRASAFGYRESEFGATLDGDETRDILLEPVPFRTITLRAQDAETGEPITGFAYTVEPGIPPATAAGSGATLDIPTGTDLTVIVGKWGYTIERIAVRANDMPTEVVARLLPRYQDDATFDLGWSYASPEDNAVTGRWNRLRPYLGYPNSDWVHPATEPAGTSGKIFFTGRPPLFAPPEQDDVSKGRTTLTSPPMDLGDYGDPMITFDLWLVQFERDTLLDSLVVELSNDDGGTWTAAYSEIKGKSGWRTHTIFPRRYLPLSDRMRIRFRVSDTLGNILVVAGMDNFDVIDRLFSSAPQEPTGPVASGHIFTLAPNPAHGSAELTLRSSGERMRVEIISPLGETLAVPFDGNLPQGEHRLPIPLNVPEGWYIVRVAGEKGKESARIIVR